MYEEHIPFSKLDSLTGIEHKAFQTWIQHPTFDEYWKSILPSKNEYEKMNIPVLTITGHFDADQVGVAIETSKNVMVFDLGLLYHTGFESLNFGISIRNFAGEITYIRDSFQLPLTFRIGLAMNIMDLTSIDKNVHSLLLTTEAIHPRDFSEQLSFGLEYEFMRMFALRAGYSFPNDEHGFSAGVGFHKDISDFNFGIDYAYTPFGIFNEVHRFTVAFGF